MPDLLQIGKGPAPSTEWSLLKQKSNRNDSGFERLVGVPDFRLGGDLRLPDLLQIKRGPHPNTE